MSSTLKEYTMNGTRITSLDTFFREFGAAVFGNPDFVSNLSAFDDVLSGGFGSPDEGFILYWTNSDVSRQNLGYARTVQELELRLQRCHPLSRDHVKKAISAARAGLGPTAFDWLIEIFSDHGPNGKYAESNVILVLK